VDHRGVGEESPLTKLIPVDRIDAVTHKGSLGQGKRLRRPGTRRSTAWASDREPPNPLRVFLNEAEHGDVLFGIALHQVDE
jgi:hypothetical protein